MTTFSTGLVLHRSESGERIVRDEQFGGADGGDPVCEGEAMRACVNDDEMVS